MDFTSDLPRFVSHKTVRAAKVVAVDFGGRLDLAPHGVVEVGPGWIERRCGGESPVGGYFIRYEDGYTSWSPAEPFEKGYTLVDGPRVIDAGHRYRLAGGQVLQFIKKVRASAPVQIGDAFIGKSVEGLGLILTADGTTTEEVLEVALDRLRTLNAVVPCCENSLAITNIEQGLMWLEKRTRDRQARAVEGTPNM